MINSPLIAFKSVLQKRWLIATLLFSFFFFSGFSGNTPDQEQQVFRTELLVASNPIVKKATVWKTTFKKYTANAASSFFPKSVCNNAVIVCNQLSKLRFDTASAQAFTFELPEKFFPVIKSSQSSEEDLTHLFRG